MSSQLRFQNNSRTGNGGPRRFGTALGSNVGSTSSGGSSSGAASSRRYTAPSSDRRAGKRSSSRGRGSRSQRARTASSDENDPISDAMGVVEVPEDQLLAANIPFVAHSIARSVKRQGWTPTLTSAVGCELLKQAGLAISVGRSGPAPSMSGKGSGEATAVSSILHQMLLLTSDFRTSPNWDQTITLETSAVLKGGFLMYKEAKGVKDFSEFAVAIKKNLRAALSLLHKGERRVCVNVLSKVIKAVHEDNSNGNGNPDLVDSRRLLGTIRRELRACPAAKKLELSEAAMKETISRGKYADANGDPVGLTQIFHCTPSLHFDMVLYPFMQDILAGGAACMAQELEHARSSAAANDHESSDEEGDPAGFIATASLRNFVRAFAKVPRGGQGEAHQHQLNKCRQRSHDFAIAAWGEIPEPSHFVTYLDAEEFFRPFLEEGAAGPLAGAHASGQGTGAGDASESESDDEHAGGSEQDSDDDAGMSLTDQDEAQADLSDELSDYIYSDLSDDGSAVSADA